MSVDTIGNFFTTIRNAIARIAKTVKIPYSHFKYKISEVLLQEGYIAGLSIQVVSDYEKYIIIELKYVNNESVIHEIKQVSTPGRRVYVNYDCTPTVIDGLGIAILTTSQGVMTNKQSKDKRIGGEFICTIW
jgi:small subunit ribosomal protein S8